MSVASDGHRVWTVLDLIKWGTSYFKEKNIESGRLTTELLLCSVLQCSRIALYSDFEHPLSAQELATLKGYIRRIVLHEPLQYIVGKADFYSFTFEVTPDVLIPRPETELLVESAINAVSPHASCLDIGTGSGAIGISVAKHSPHTSWLCIDKSKAALAVARRNADIHGVSAQCTFECIDILSSLPTSTFDMICMNPPYIPAADVATLEPNVRDYEPHQALTDDADGLQFYRRLADIAPKILRPHGVMIFELGWGQQNQVEPLFASNWTTRIRADLAGIPRVIEIRQSNISHNRSVIR